MAQETLDRFIKAQNDGQYGSTFSRALTEIRQNGKTSHWIWYIFPQIAGMASTETSKKFSISDFQEAKNYLKNKPLRDRLIQITSAVKAALEKTGTSTNDLLGGEPDVSKFQASLTLFLLAAHENNDVDAYTLFKETLKLAFSTNTLHQRTLELLNKTIKSINDMPINLALTIKIPEPISVAKPTSENKKAEVPQTFAFSFSRTERFFQWLYNLTHSEKNQFKKQDINTLKPARSALWKWLMGLGKPSKHLDAQKKTQSSNKKAIPTADDNDPPLSSAQLKFDRPDLPAQKVTEAILPSPEKKLR